MPILYVSHSPAEVARLATTVVALREGRVAAAGPPGQVLGDVAAVGVRDVASVLRARVFAHHEDGLSELETAAGPLHLPRVPEALGTVIRVRIAANEVILSRVAPKGRSALNVLRGTIVEIQPGRGPAARVVLPVGKESLTARITQRSVATLGLEPGQACHAIVKSVAVAPEDVGRGQTVEAAH